MRGGDLDGLVEAVALEDVEPADRLLRLDERAVRHELPAVAHANRAGATRRREAPDAKFAARIRTCPEPVYVYFRHDDEPDAPKHALRLMEMLAL